MSRKATTIRGKIAILAGIFLISCMAGIWIITSSGSRPLHYRTYEEVADVNELQAQNRYMAQEKKIKFTGQVLYESGDPVPDALVIVELYSIYGPDGDKLPSLTHYEINQNTNADGIFEVDGTANYIRIIKVSGPGDWLYDRDRIQYSQRVPGNTYFSFSHANGEKFYIPDPKNPAIFIILRPNRVIKSWPSRGGEDSFGVAGSVVNTPLKPKRPSVQLKQTNEGWVYQP